MLFIFNVFFLSRQMIHCLTISKFIFKKNHSTDASKYLSNIYSIPSVRLQNVFMNMFSITVIVILAYYIVRLVCELGRSPTKLTGSSAEDKRFIPRLSWILRAVVTERLAFGPDPQINIKLASAEARLNFLGKHWLRAQASGIDSALIV